MPKKKRGWRLHRQAPDLPVDGPWLVTLVHSDYFGATFSIRHHSRAAVAAGRECWSDEVEPSTDDDGYFIPDGAINVSEGKVVTAELLSLVPDLIDAAVSYVEIEKESQKEIYEGFKDGGSLSIEECDALVLPQIDAFNRLREAVRKIQAIGFRNFASRYGKR